MEEENYDYGDRLVDKYYQSINKSLEEYENVHIIDFQQSYNSSYFADPEHLNYEGAKLFSKSLRNALIEQEILS